MPGLLRAARSKQLTPSPPSAEGLKLPDPTELLPTSMLPTGVLVLSSCLTLGLIPPLGPLMASSLSRILLASTVSKSMTDRPC